MCAALTPDQAWRQLPVSQITRTEAGRAAHLWVARPSLLGAGAGPTTRTEVVEPQAAAARRNLPDALNRFDPLRGQ
jgi:hypothetical protein